MAHANKQLNTLAPLPIPIPSGGIQVQLNTLAEGAPRAAWATQNPRHGRGRGEARGDPEKKAMSHVANMIIIWTVFNWNTSNETPSSVTGHRLVIVFKL